MLKHIGRGLSGRKIIACSTVIEEMRPYLPSCMEALELDFRLHLSPDDLRRALQEAVNVAGADADIILLGYGLCSNAVVGLRATNCTLVVPRVDDCIAIFLGSAIAYRQQSSKEPGTYYLSKGWIDVGGSLFAKHKQLIERYGQERADRMTRLVLKAYTRLAFIRTGSDNPEYYREYCHSVAKHFGLRYEEIPGNPILIKKMIFGPWDGDFVVASPGQIITLADFMTTKVRS